MSKVKNLSQSQNSNIAASYVGSSQSVSSTEQADVFNTILASASTEDATSQKKNKEDDLLGNKDAETNASEQVTEDAPVKTEASSETKEVLSEEDKQELKNIDEYKLSMAAIAQQLNISLQPVIQEIKGDLIKGNANIRFTEQQESLTLQTAVKAIPQELLRKVDVKTLGEQLDKLAFKDSALDVDVSDLNFVKDDSVNDLSKLVDESEDAAALMPLTDKEEAMADMILERYRLSLEGDKNTLPADVSSALNDLKDVIPGLDLEDITGSDKYDSPLFEGKIETIDVFLTPSQMMDQMAASTGPHPSQQQIQMPNLHAANPAQLAAFTRQEFAKIQAKVEEAIQGSVREGRSSTTRLQMHPETLGRIEITIDIKEASVRADIVTDNQEASRLLAREIPHIKAMLAADNFNLDNFTARHDQNHFQAQQGQAETRREPSRGFQNPENAEARMQAEKMVKGPAARARRDSMINLTV